MGHTPCSVTSGPLHGLFCAWHALAHLPPDLSSSLRVSAQRPFPLRSLAWLSLQTPVLLPGSLDIFQSLFIVNFLGLSAEDCVDYDRARSSQNTRVPGKGAVCRFVSSWTASLCHRASLTGTDPAESRMYVLKLFKTHSLVDG